MRMTPRLLVVCLAGVLVGCGAHVRPDVKPSAPPVAPLPVQSFQSNATAGQDVAIKPDPEGVLIASVEREFTTGQKEQQAGRLVAARSHFDAAVDALMAAPGGARQSQRLAAEFDSLLDRVSALDVIALHDADGFTETETEPAALDELLSTAATFERPEPAATTEETVDADLDRTPHDIDIPLNDRVLSFVELFQGRLHDFMQNGLTRGLRYLPMIQKVFRADGVPLDLAYVPLVESAFKPTALSRASARGMWQFMADTGTEHGLQQNWFLDERADPEKATEAAATYLKTLRDMFDGDWNLALASYNAGPGRVQRAIKLAHTSNYWTLSASTRYLPRDTRDYVPMIMAAMIIGANPSLYGFDLGAPSPVAYENVTVPDALDLKIIAEWVGVSVDDLRDLNPELRRTTTPMGDHELKVPLGTAATIQTKLATADPQYVHFNFYTVKRGDTLASVARKYKMSQNELRLANDLSVRAKIKTNQSLMIPQRAASGLPASPAARTVTAAAAPARSSSGGPLTYRVQPGDTLFSIAKRFDTSVDTLKRLNSLHSTQINAGARLTVR
jgi:membrane-bound lytic murein transglycosylase D